MSSVNDLITTNKLNHDDLPAESRIAPTNESPKYFSRILHTTPDLCEPACPRATTDLDSLNDDTELPLSPEMAGYNPLPPYVLHTSTRLSHHDALHMLTTFLDRANDDAAYRPDSTLTDRGPQSTSVATKSDLTLHHLDRIKLGLEGKRVGGDELENSFFGAAKGKKRKWGADVDRDEEGIAQVGLRTTSRQANGRARPQREMVEDVNEDGLGMTVTEEVDEWQDKEEYELAQEDDEVDMHNAQRDPGAGLQRPLDQFDEREMLDVEIQRADTSDIKTPQKSIEQANDGSQSTGPRTIDKEDRKRRKKERQKAERLEKEQKKVKNL